MGVIHWSDQEVEVTEIKEGSFCSYCGGKGWTEFGKCDICRGTGKIVRKVK